MFQSFSEQAYERAFEYDVVNDPSQDILTEQLVMPNIGEMVSGLQRIRRVVDERCVKMLQEKKSTGNTAYGLISPKEYPVGYCGIIRDMVFDVMKQSPLMLELCDHGLIFKKIYIILNGEYLQNAIQLGHLYLDVANDTVDPRKEKVVWKPLRELSYTCFETFDGCFTVAERYLNARLFPNLIFPKIAPMLPVFAIDENGRISLFREHMVVAFKSIVRNHQPAREFFLSSPFARRRLPPPYVALIKAECNSKKGRLPFECVEQGTAQSVVNWIETQLQSQGPMQDRADGLLFNAAMLAYDKLSRLNLAPHRSTVAALRADGFIPKPRPKAF